MASTSAATPQHAGMQEDDPAEVRGIMLDGDFPESLRHVTLPPDMYMTSSEIKWSTVSWVRASCGRVAGLTPDSVKWSTDLVLVPFGLSSRTGRKGNQREVKMMDRYWRSHVTGLCVRHCRLPEV